MTVEEAVCARILSLAPVTAIVSTRVWLGKLHQNTTYPCVLVRLVDDLEGQHLRGRDGTPIARVQVDCYAHDVSGVDTYGQVAALASAVHGDGLGTTATGLFGWTGVIGSPGFEILAIDAGPRLFDYTPEELKVVRMFRDYLVRYRA